LRTASAATPSDGRWQGSARDSGMSEHTIKQARIEPSPRRYGHGLEVRAGLCP
jgi:hypothetical protein